ncbi:hypothetical protein SAMD00019534_100450 [Acytostelium subglobosum LB1]|uniref:hypothetical protein n=1 Tax=Acytostelium subglobosum LB1 TaxID=1410327 RepID=UPI00064517DE|nr:hypothetical protein SAMD00019534_100450 [Acytostelium subglobosum LB1]GAM26870.1 hypothetical protein SAMD00019534_100450 [Acytostelium subglobosum LB1]|eukprot:XP_012750138.1 hypothetical protein SAMD00019534_100450 [Acytostelium subglobosum LB1]
MIDVGQLNDDQLMSMVTRHTEHIQQVPYDDESLSSLKSFSVNTNTTKLSSIKRQIEECFELVESTGESDTGLANDVPHKLDGHIMSMSGNKCSLFSMEACRWTEINGTFNKSLGRVDTSAVYARGSVYVFGSASATKYVRYSLGEKKCYEGDIVGVCGDQYLAVCYDGDHNIYLVGGRVGDRLEVSTFDIDTRLFSQVGLLSLPFISAPIFYYQDCVHIVDQNNGIVSFNVKTKAIDYDFMDLELDETNSCCFDGEGNVYVLTQDTFTRCSMSTGRSTKLADCPMETLYGKLVYDKVFGIYYIVGRGGNYRYSIKSNKWKDLEDGDPSAERGSYGMCLIRD